MGEKTHRNAQLSVLLDTNIVLALEGDENADHVNNVKASFVFRLISEASGRALILENQLDDLARIPDQKLRDRRRRQLRKYPRKNRVQIPAWFLEQAEYSGSIEPRGNNAVDAALLLALHRNTASWLITEDRGVHAHARHLGLQERVLTLIEAESALGALTGTLPASHFSAEIIEPHTLDTSGTFFDSLRGGYETFGDWWTGKVVTESRPCLLIGSPSQIRGLSVLVAQDHESLPGTAMKICTFKISEEDQGRKLGETLLDATISFIRKSAADSCFIEVSEAQASLVGLLKEFGFFTLGYKDGQPNETVLGKVLNPEVEITPPSDPLDFNRRYGPGMRHVNRAFVVPIIPRFHSMLFPASDPQLSLFDSTYGNAVRKVYISHAGIKTLVPGDTLFFLRTHERQAIQAIGIVEQILRTERLDEVLSFAGMRTVYSVKQLEALCRKEVLAIKFRLDEVLEQPISKAELIALGVFGNSPQSISQIKKEEGIEWAQSLQDV